MKKIFITTFLTLILVFSAIQPAEAGLKVDFGMVTGKVSGFVQKINEGVQKVTQQINHVKKMASQGFNLDAIKGKAQGFIKQGKSMAQNFLKSQLKMLIASAAKQRAEEKAAAKELYQEALQQKYQAQLNLIDENINELDNQISETEDKIRAKSNECGGYKSSAAEGDSEAVTAYSNCSMELTRLEEDKKAFSELKTSLQHEKEETSEQAKEIGTAKDAEYQANKQREELVNETAKEEKKDPVQAEFGSNDEWDKVDVSKFEKKDEYKKFAEQYFYDPKKVDNTSGAIVHQSKIDRITRDRRYLFVNTATHLMQVATTARYQKEQINKAVKDIADSTAEGTGTTEQIQTFSLTRWQNTKALLVYAKILSAKLQYLAARGLLTAELQKDLDNNPDYSAFNPEIYDLTKEYVGDLYKSQSVVKKIGE